MQVSNIVIGDKPIDLNRTYRFTVPSFNAAGGDGYPKLSEHPSYVNTGYVDAEVLKDFIQKNSPINIADFIPKNE